MFDSNISTQLRTVFRDLESQITLLYYNSDHQKQQELEQMLEEIASFSPKIAVAKSCADKKMPSFELLKDGVSVGVDFSGIPGGHEFTSLILAILNLDGKGKLPDARFIERIKSLKDKIELRTFISLSCENCPDIVQALNLMAILNENISHEMVDGEFVTEEIKERKIQGVPSVFCNGESLHHGKSTLVELLEKLERKFGVEKLEYQDLGSYDVAVIGGGPAGISSAIYTARKGLKTAVITDKIGGQLQETEGIENFISVPYIKGQNLSAAIAEHASGYDLEILEHRKLVGIENEGFKKLTLSSNEILTAKSLIIATGAKWKRLGIQGEEKYLGRGVAFCPHCDGPYYAGKNIVVIGGGNSGVEAAIDLSAIAKSVTLVEYSSQLKADEVLIKKLKDKSNINILTDYLTTKIIGDEDRVTSLEIKDRKTGVARQLYVDGIFVQIGLSPNTEYFKGLVELNALDEIVIDHKCRTSAERVYAAGDVTSVPYKQIIVSMGEGAKAGLTVFEDLMMAE